MMRSFLLEPLVLGLLLFADTAFGQQQPVTASIVSEQSAIVPGKTFTIGLKMVHGPGWHTYWLNPGTGQATKVKWELPAGFETGPMILPQPEVKVDDVIGNTHIYHGTVYHLFKVKAPENLSPGASVTLSATVSWLQCLEDSCDPPVKKALEITLPVATTATLDPIIEKAFKKTLDEQAQPVSAWSIATEQDATTYTLVLTPKEDTANPDPGAIYLFEEEQTLESVNPTIVKDGSVFKVTLPKVEEDNLASIKGFLYAPNGWLKTGLPKAMTLATTTVGENAAAGVGGGEGDGAAAYVSASGNNSPITLPKALFFFLIGGMILNLMPCVFPVLSIKILGFVDQAGEDTLSVKKHGLAFGFGVLVSMWALVAILLAVKASTGEAIHWGSHLGNPYIAGGIVLLMVLIGLNLLGFFEIGTSLMNVGGGLAQKKGLSGSFYSGVLTTVIATPCTGPFLGAAFGFAFTQASLTIILLFTVFAIGVALPYVLLSFFPALVDKLPRPGAWMETFKNILAFPMFAAGLFFFYGFAKTTGYKGATWFLVGVLIVALAAWVYGHWCTISRSSGVRMRGRLATVILGLLGLYVAYGAAQERAETGGQLASAEQRIRDLRNEGRMVYADFTASW